MKAFLKYIAVLDVEDKLHYVQFTKGVNVITGKSSTGKSAMIEIFDYCFGSSDYTIPAGIITEKAKLFFIVLGVGEAFLILARKPFCDKAFLKEEAYEFISDISNFTSDYFENCDWVNLSYFKGELGRYFGLDTVDVDEDERQRKFRGKKLQKPTIRNIVSYILQHQGLIANKHSLFYRFDEKEKREQVIDQFKIFSSFVDPDYYIKKQELNQLKDELKKLEQNKDTEKLNLANQSKKLMELLNEFGAISGKELLAGTSAEKLLKLPKKALSDIQDYIIEIDYQSNAYTDEFKELQESRNQNLLEKRNFQTELRNVKSSIIYAKSYSNDVQILESSGFDKNSSSTCPFCKSDNDKLQQESNKLRQAVDWLNKELAKTPYILESFKAEEWRLIKEIREKTNEITRIDGTLNKLKKINENLKNKLSLESQASKTLYKIQAMLENLCEDKLSSIEEEIKLKENAISKLEEELSKNYAVEAKMKEARKIISERMNQIGANFDFEDSFKPINLEFDLDNFELWHNKNNKRIYLRSMGSGANWLYSHLTLFLALQYYFCVNEDQKKVPPILFLDQPSQVYFPSIETDYDGNFDPNQLKNETDIKLVTDLYEQIVNHCNQVENDTGVIPQIIITDHADHLTLKNADFEKLVSGRRWRDRGFILKNSITKEDEIMQFLHQKVFDPILNSPDASDKLKKGVRFTIMRMRQRDALGMISYVWSAISGTDKSIKFADVMSVEGFKRFEEVGEEFNKKFNEDWLKS